MHPYVLAPLAACLASSACAAVIAARDSAHRANRRAAALVAGAAWWACCEVLWNTAGDPVTALRLVRLSAAGWVWIGPLAVDLFLSVVSDPAPRLRRALPGLYAAAGAFLVLTLFTPWMHRAVLPTSWGYAYEFGWLYPPFLLFTLVLLNVALVIGWRAAREAPAESERSQAVALGVAILFPLCVASVTDGLLPLFGVQWPRFGTLSFVGLAAIITWSLHRYGYSLLAPGNFAREILETLPEGVALLHLDGRVRSHNTGMARLAALSPGLLEDRQLVERLTLPVLSWPEGVRDHECELVLAPDRRMPMAVSSSILRDKQDRPIGVVLVLRDIGEVVDLRRRLLVAGRLAAVDQLAAGIAHEINNPIAFLRTNLGVLRDHWRGLADAGAAGPGSPRAAELLEDGNALIEESLEGADRIAEVVRDVKRFGRGAGDRRKPTEIRELLESVLRFTAPHLPAGARIERSFGDVPLVPCAPHELELVFLNLLKNACQAVGEGGRVAVRTARQGAVAAVFIEDDGPGIPAEQLESIFDPFFTTRPIGESTGLGLAIAYEIVRRHGGELQVRSARGEGTRVEVRLPLGEPFETLP
jgi:signal transduction histidine kinase